MTKVKLKDATKELNNNAGVLLEEAARTRRNAESLLRQLNSQKAQFKRQEDEARALAYDEEMKQLAEQHTKAWTMPDEDEALAQAAAQNQPAAKTEEAPVAPKASAKAATKPQTDAHEAAPKPAAPKKASEQAKTNAEAAPKQYVKPEPAPQQPPKAEDAAQPAQAEAAPQQPAIPEVAPVQPAAVATAPAPSAKPEAPAEATAAPAMPQGAAARPQTAAPQGSPTRPQGNAAGPYGRPANPAGPYGRPANPAGPYGRPANPAGPYGRPANPAGPYGRPANPAGQSAQPAQPGQFGRPANPAGPFGRPATPGQFGRPATPGQFGRPATPGQFGRPATPGQFGRPATPGQFGRPATPGVPGRPPMGGPRPGARTRGPELTPSVEKERVSNYDPNKKQYIRQHDPEHITKTRKQIARENFTGYDDDVVRGGKRARAKKPSAQQLMAPIKIDKAIMTAENITVKDLTERIGKPAGDILKKLLMLGVMSNINSELDYDTASLVCQEFGVDLEMQLAKTAEDYLSDEDYDDDEGDLSPRPPVITIMGHVDHGKTSLLDYIRSAHVTQTEAGGITQHIGAYTVTLNGRNITFLDTPGHEAFTAMRARGAQATDIAILVVAADDGVMPQTIEAINHCKAAEVPIIIAINKMDKVGANPDRVRQDLTAYNLVPEEWGGDTIMTPVSAVTGEGVDTLLEMILLEADMLQLRANPDRMARGVIIEAKLDKARGPLATVLIQNGTLKVGDNVVAGMASGRVRSMLNDRGERVMKAGPSTPVEVSGFADVPQAGDDMMAVEDDHLSRQVAQERRDKLKASRVSATKVSLDNLFAGIAEGKIKNLNLIIKADVQGSVEAVKQALEKLSNDEVKVRVLHSAVGSITQDDVNMASAFNAIIVGFNIRPDASARDAAEREGIDIRLYRIIYQAIEDIQLAMKGLLAPQYREVILGHAEVRETFRITGAGTIAGCYVQDGKLQRNASVRLLRDNVVVFEGKLSSLKRFKDDAREVAQSFECGCGLEGYNDIKQSDIIECFNMEEIER